MHHSIFEPIRTKEPLQISIPLELLFTDPASWAQDLSHQSSKATSQSWSAQWNYELQAV